MAKPGLFSSLGLLSNKEIANTAPATADGTYLQDMQKLLKGDVSSALTSGEKLMALGALLKSGARGSQVSPQQVMAQVQQTAQNRAATQMQLAQLQAKAQREQGQKMFIDQYSSVLPESKKGLLKNLDTPEAMKLVQEEVFRPKQVQQIVRTGDGETRIIYQDGTDQIANWKLPEKTKYQDVGGKLVLVNEDTGDVIKDAQGNPRELPKSMAPGEAARLNLSQQQFDWSRAHGGSSGGGSGKLPAPQYKTINGKAGWYSWNGQQWVPAGSQNVAPPAAGSLLEQQLRGMLGEGGGGRLLRN